MRALNSDENNTSDPLFDFFSDRSRLFMSEGDGTFVETGESLGLDHEEQGRGVICTD
ncbi:MAG: hypothetical protein U5K76_15510 [Woeseiaceae bacterium]|nr:hypothetical protein [Woeseiaceae bacterium]